MKINIQKSGISRSPPIRAVSLMLAVFIFCFSLIPEAKATEIDDGYGFMELLDYSTVDNTGTNRVDLASGTNTFYVDCPFDIRLNYVDIVFYMTKVPTSFGCGNEKYGFTSLKVLNITGAYYRAYGYISNHTYDSLGIQIVSPSTASFCLYSFQVRLTSGSGVADKVSMNGWFGSTYYSQTLATTDEYVNASATISNSTTTFDCNITPLNWERYDYFDITVSLEVYEINSISADCGGVAVPISYNVVNTGSSYGDIYYLTIRLDLSDLDRTGDDPYIRIKGYCMQGVNSISLWSGVGILNLRYEDPVLYWLKTLYASQVGSLEEITNLVEAIGGNLGNLTAYVYQGLISSDGTPYLKLLEEWNASIYDLLDSTYTMLDTRLSEMGRLLSAVVYELDVIERDIVTWGQNIVDALTPDSTAAEDVSGEMEDQRNEMQDVQDQLDTATKPSTDEMQTDISGIVSSDDVVLASAGLSAVMQVDMFAQMFTLSLVFMLASYVLFGKR